MVEKIKVDVDKQLLVWKMKKNSILLKSIGNLLLLLLLLLLLFYYYYYIVCKFVKILIFIKIFWCYYEYSRHKRPVSVLFYSFPKTSRQYFILRGNVVTELLLPITLQFYILKWRKLQNLQKIHSFAFKNSNIVIEGIIQKKIFNQFYFCRTFFLIASYQILQNDAMLINHGSFFQEKDFLQLNHFQFLKINSLMAETIKKQYFKTNCWN